MLDIIKDSSLRIKTALVLFAVFSLVSLIDTLFLTWIFLGIIMLIGISEAMKLFSIEDNSAYQFASIAWILIYFYPQAFDLLAFIIIVYASILAYSKKIDKKIILVILYPLASFLFLFTLYSEFGMQVLWWILFIVASTDIGAYYIGRAFGKTKFCETSPKKTIEGVIGGIVFASLLGPLFALSELSYIGALIISLFVALSSIFGDLFESYLKREANVKDSGDILPGHGGVLDRTDGFLFAGVIMLVILRAVL